MQTPWVTGLIVICDKFEYKVVHASCYLFGECKLNVKGIRESCSFLLTVVKTYLKFVSPEKRCAVTAHLKCILGAY